MYLWVNYPDKENLKLMVIIQNKGVGKGNSLIRTIIPKWKQNFYPSLFYQDFFFLISDTICYDDACHLKKFSTNAKRCELTATAKRIKALDMVCDKFHFPNHVDSWCKANCNPYTTSSLQVKKNLFFLYIHVSVKVLYIVLVHLPPIP